MAVPVVLVAALVIVGLRVLTRPSVSAPDVQRPSPLPAYSGTCATIVVAASADSFALLTDLAGEYTRQTNCARVSVLPEDSGDVEQALARGWDERVDGVFPDVWLPAASSWVELAHEHTPALVPPPASVPSIAKTPLVIAMPVPMAQALGWPKHPVGWSELRALARDPRGWGRYGHAEWGPFRMGKTNPTVSTSGLHATVAAFAAAGGHTAALTAADVDDPRAQEYVRDLEYSAVHYGTIVQTFLDNLQKADDAGDALGYVSAAAVPEKSVWGYNRGDLRSTSSTAPPAHLPPRVKLAAIHPREGTLYADQPYVVLAGNRTDEAKQAVASHFLRYLLSEPVQERFRDVAFRDARGAAGPVIKDDPLLTVGSPKALPVPPAAVLDRVTNAWLSALRKRARVLVLLDVSGSMNNIVPGTGQTRLQLAKQATRQALELFAPDDDVGLWTFTTASDGRPVHEEVAPIAAIGPRLAGLKNRIDHLATGNDTPLYQVTDDAVRQVRDTYDPDRINAVVLVTDGRQDPPDDAALLRLRGTLTADAARQAPVRVFSIGYAEADEAALKSISDDSQGSYYPASDPATIEKVLRGVVSNF
ncbi:hypothetical protein FrCorBMG51_00115 [Protofrankia coriariae]|uniref:VWFA domain-containing protein n=1 Tax=Protofrankia coriariae TaxID=1562887 RepID=A0ABR5F8W8_9ACTN|nr:hypothetical protein FrCorBMG51_00115 [Protofrankia coriariae]